MVTTGFLFNTEEVSTDDRDIWWNGLEFVPGARMYSVGELSSIDATITVDPSKLAFGAFEPTEGQGFVVEVEDGGATQYVLVLTTSVENFADITFQWRFL